MNASDFQSDIGDSQDSKFDSIEKKVEIDTKTDLGFGNIS